MTSSLNILKDERGNCYSIMTTLTIGQYLSSVDRSYKNKGGIEGQRDALKTSTAIRIRKRMIEDLRMGAILPPIVLGVVVPEEVFDTLSSMDEETFSKLLNEIPSDNIFIIDGMQRTTALKEVNNDIDISKNNIRVEYWISSNTNRLIYRMLILNTGQVPWNLRRQIEIVFRSMIAEIKSKIPSIDVFEIDEQRRRTVAGQFQAHEIIELFLVFGARKEKIDTKERLADEFTRLDFIEATADSDFTKIFYEILQYLADFDKAFGKFQGDTSQGDTTPTDGKFIQGKDLLSSQPARVGFVTAIALAVLGRPGMQHTPEQQTQRWGQIKKDASELINKIRRMEVNDLEAFLDFNTLNALISQRSSKIGDFEREFFLKAFKVMIEENFEVDSLTPCWRAY